MHIFPNLYNELNKAPNIFLTIIPRNKQITSRMLLEGPVSNPALFSNVVLKHKYKLPLNYIHKKVPSVAVSSVKVKVNCSCYRSGCGPGVGRGTALLFHDRGTRRG